MGADIFVSYAREDEPRIHDLVAALERKGWSVFWDHRIPAGQSWRSSIGRALDETRCAIVVWSSASIASEFVIEEASRARKRGALVPVRLDPVEPPLGFGELNAADLSGWQRGQPSPEFDQLVQDLAAVLETRPAAAEREPAPVATPASASAPAARPQVAPAHAAARPVEDAPRALRRSRAWTYGAIALGAVVAAAVALFFIPDGSAPGSDRIEVHPAQPSPSSTTTRGPEPGTSQSAVPPGHASETPGTQATATPATDATATGETQPGTGTTAAQPPGATPSSPGEQTPPPVVKPIPLKPGTVKPATAALHATQPAEKVKPLPPKSVRQALNLNKYEVGWSGAPLGTPDEGFSQSAVTKIIWRGTDVADIELARPSYLHARASGRMLSGSWKDVDGTGDFELRFNEDYSRAEGWWNRGAVTQKYNMYVRRTD